MKLYINSLLILTLLLAVSASVGYALLHWLFPQFYFVLYPLVPLYFLAMGVTLIVVFQSWKDAPGRQFFTVYMLTRVLKILVSIAIAFLYCYLGGANKEAFLISFVLFYFVYLAFETWIFSQKVKGEE